VDATVEINGTIEFAAHLRRHGIDTMARQSPRTIQVNVGKLCNQACHHCHVDAGPKRTERMTRRVAERVAEVIARSRGIETVDITGGAPELNENFRFLVEAARRLDRHVMVRCNLTVILEPGMQWLPVFYRESAVHLVCSMPCYTADNVDKQRGSGVFRKSIEALRLLNGLGYAVAGSGLVLDLVYNPVGAFLPPPQEELEGQYRRELGDNFGVEFDHLLTITNMPISRFAEQLRRLGEESAYMSLLVNHFNPATVERLMCRELVSVGYDGALYDCDFNQMLELPISGGLSIFDLNDVAELAGMRIATASHCFGCTAGAGSGCGGALA
jgi:radical SAM/Cys-rich protein